MTINFLAIKRKHLHRKTQQIGCKLDANSKFVIRFPKIFLCAPVLLRIAA